MSELARLSVGQKNDVSLCDGNDLADLLGFEDFNNLAKLGETGVLAFIAHTSPTRKRGNIAYSLACASG